MRFVAPTCPHPAPSIAPSQSTHRRRRGSIIRSYGAQREVAIVAAGKLCLKARKTTGQRWVSGELHVCLTWGLSFRQ